MSKTSIDGLKRKSIPTNSKKAARRGTDNSFEAPTTRREIKERTASSRIQEAKTAEQSVDNEREQAIKDFFNEVKDTDPTDLTEIPKKERKKEKKRKQKKHKVLKRVIIIILILLLGAGVAVYAYFNDFVAKITDGGSLLGLIFSDPDTPLEKDEYGRTNILIFGTEGYSMDDPNYDGGFLTDSMMLLSINQENGDAKAISLPRDLKARRTCTSTGKFNEIYYCEYSKADKNSEESKKEFEKKASLKLSEAFEDVLGVTVQYRVHANWAAVIRIVDAIGGIDVVFTYGDQEWNGDETVIKTTSKKGLGDLNHRKKYNFEYANGQPYHLDGGQALAVARTRNAYGGYGAANGNFSREYFQQRIIEAIVTKARKINLLSDLMAALQIKDAVGDNIRTDFKDTELKTLIKLGGTINFTALETISLFSTDDKPAALMKTANINGISYVVPTAGVNNYGAIHTYIKRKFTAAPHTSENAQLVVLNGTAATGIANKEKTELEDDGYIVSSIGNAPNDQSGFDGVRVYQKNTKLEKTAAALKDLYKVDLATEIPESLASYEADFIVIVGNGYKHPK